jgi:phosphoribosylformylglycinamidine synthase PurS subunit
MKFTAEINVMPLKALLDPQGKTITKSLGNLGMTEIIQVRAGKHFTIELEASSMDEAKKLVETACNKLLVNQIMEYFEYEISEA